MSDQEMRAVFESVEPRLWLIKRGKGVRTIIAIVIVGCIVGFLALKISNRTNRSPAVQPHATIDVGPAGAMQAAPEQKLNAGRETEKARKDTGDAGRPARGTYDSPLSF